MPITKKQLIQMLIDSDIPDDAVVINTVHDEYRYSNGKLYPLFVEDREALYNAFLTNPSKCNAFEII